MASIDRVPLLDVSRGTAPLEAQIQAAMQAVIESGRFVYGPDCPQLEQEVAEICECTYGIGRASGSDALLVAMMALGIGPGDEVILPSFTFFATGSAVVRLGATPVFVDILPDTMNLDPVAVESAITRQTKAITPVHLFGQCADMTEIMRIAEDHDLLVIEDAAQAISASHNNRRAASFGNLGCFSFYPTKNLGAFGDAGMIVTNDQELAKHVRLIANHGMEPRYHHHIMGVNSRLDSLQAAVLRVKLTQLESWNERRAENAQRYTEMLDEANLPSIQLPTAEEENSRHVWNQFTIRVIDGQRDALRQHLSDRGIGTEIYSPIPVHKQPCFVEHGGDIDLPETDAAAAEVLSLPIFPELTVDELAYVVDGIRSFYNAQQAAA